MAPPPPLETIVRERFPPGTAIEALKGDASTRRFFRLRPPAGPSKIVMLYPEAIVWEGSPLAESYRHLERIGVPLAKIEAVLPEAGAILMADLGDLTLQQALRADPALDRTRLYREAIDFIVLLQTRGTRELPDSPARRTALDEARFLFELEHFYRHFILGYRRASPAPAEAAACTSFFGWLAASLDGVSRVLCHRDFQSRNLMVTAAGLQVIDYQDARLGPASYDLASLLRDSSLDLEEGFREEGIRYFLSRRAELAPEEFRAEFERQALQRNIKDLGTFGYQVSHVGNRGFEEYIPRTVRMVRQAMLREARCHRLFPLFEKYVFSAPGV